MAQNSSRSLSQITVANVGWITSLDGLPRDDDAELLLDGLAHERGELPSSFSIVLSSALVCSTKTPTGMLNVTAMPLERARGWTSRARLGLMERLTSPSIALPPMPASPAMLQGCRSSRRFRHEHQQPAALFREPTMLWPARIARPPKPRPRSARFDSGRSASLWEHHREPHASDTRTSHERPASGMAAQTVSSVLYSGVTDEAPIAWGCSDYPLPPPPPSPSRPPTRFSATMALSAFTVT